MERTLVDLPFWAMSSCLPWLDQRQAIETIRKINGVNGFELSVDVSGARSQDLGDHVATHFDIDAYTAKPEETAKGLVEVLNANELGVKIGAYDRIHSHDPKQDEKVLDRMLKLIDLAAALGGKNGGNYGVSVGFFWGRDAFKGLWDNFDAVAKKLYVLGRYAADRGVMITVENCHMPGGWPRPKEQDLPEVVVNNVACTLDYRKIIAHKLKEMKFNPKEIGLIWDPSHGETQCHPDVTYEAKAVFADEMLSIIGLHTKGHNHRMPGNYDKMARQGGPAIPGLWAVPKAKDEDPDGRYELMVKLGITPGKDAWGRQYGQVTLYGVGDHSLTTPMPKIISIARDAGFNGPVIAENESPEKWAALGEKDADAMVRMYSDCCNALVTKAGLWAGTKYAGEPFKKLEVAKGGLVAESLTWKQACEKYKIPDKVAQ